MVLRRPWASGGLMINNIGNINNDSNSRSSNHNNSNNSSSSSNNDNNIHSTNNSTCRRPWASGATPGARRPASFTIIVFMFTLFTIIVFMSIITIMFTLIVSYTIMCTIIVFMSIITASFCNRPASFYSGGRLCTLICVPWPGSVSAPSARGDLS